MSYGRQVILVNYTFIMMILIQDNGFRQMLVVEVLLDLKDLQELQVLKDLQDQ